MARKKNDDEPTVVVVRKMPDFASGDETGLDSVVHCDKLTTRRQKGGQITRDMEVTMDLGGVSGGWPTHLAAFRGAVLQGMAKDGEAFTCTLHPNVELKATVSTVSNDEQLGMLSDSPCILRRIKLSAKEDNGEIRWTFRFTKTDGMAQEFEDALGSSLMFGTTSLQQSLFPKVETLPPEAGEQAH